MSKGKTKVSILTSVSQKSESKAKLKGDLISGQQRVIEKEVRLGRRGNYF